MVDGDKLREVRGGGVGALGESVGGDLLGKDLLREDLLEENLLGEDLLGEDLLGVVLGMKRKDVEGDVEVVVLGGNGCVELVLDSKAMLLGGLKSVVMVALERVEMIELVRASEGTLLEVL